jgi:hypothetical protein
VKIVVALLLAVPAVLLSLSGAASGDCGSPYIKVDSERLQPGDQVVVTGTAFFDACIDTHPNPRTAKPITGITVRFEQGSRSWVISRVDAGEDFAFSTRAKVPAGAASGPATVTASAGPWGTVKAVRPLLITGTDHASAPNRRMPTHRSAPRPLKAPDGGLGTGMVLFGCFVVAALGGSVGVLVFRRVRAD